MYSSIDLVSHKLAQSMKKHNEKLRDKRRKERSMAKEELAAAELADPDDSFDIESLLVDLDQKYRSGVKYLPKKPLQIVRPKKFTMPPISVEEAVSQLETIDHPFYVFRNKDSNEINVVYRRKEGDVGVIMPEN